MAQAKVKPGKEGQKIWAKVGGKRIQGKLLSELTSDELQAILDSDPRNASRFIDGVPSKLQGKTDNKPGEPLPEKPKA